MESRSENIKNVELTLRNKSFQKIIAKVAVLGLRKFPTKNYEKKRKSRNAEDDEQDGAGGGGEGGVDQGGVPLERGDRAVEQEEVNWKVSKGKIFRFGQIDFQKLFLLLTGFRNIPEEKWVQHCTK